MSRLSAYSDRYAQRRGFSLNGAIAYTAMYAFLICLGLFQLHAVLKRQGEPYYLYAGPLILILGIFGALRGIQVIRAIRRRSNI